MCNRALEDVNGNCIISSSSSTNRQNVEYPIGTIANLSVAHEIPLSKKSTRLGSGFVYDKQGHIITNTHVIDGANTADVTFVDGNAYKAKVIGKDPSSDIAVLQITDNFSPENLVPLPIVNSSSVQVGQQVIAIGNPFGLCVYHGMYCNHCQTTFKNMFKRRHISRI